MTDYLPELKQGGYNGVSIRHILQMRSGVDYEERYDFGNPGTAARNHEQALVKNIARFADAARTIKRLHPPGQVWQYKTLDTAVLGWLLERVVRRKRRGGVYRAAPVGAARGGSGWFLRHGWPAGRRP